MQTPPPMPPGYGEPVPQAQPPMPPPGAAGPPKGRFRTGLHLMGVSWQVVKSEPSLLVLPVLSGIFAIMLFAGLTGVLWSTGTLERVFGSSASEAADVAQLMTPTDWAALVLYYLVSAFGVVFFNAALISNAMARLEGRNPTLGDGLRAAAKHWRKILLWAAITATVGVILRWIRDQGVIGAIVAGIIGFAWAVITFFVVPVILFEDVGTVASIKRSASLFRQRWGEQLTGTIGITAIFFIVGFVAVAIGVGVAFVVLPLGILMIVVTCLAVAVLAGAVQGVFNAALYRYATTGTVGAGFTEAELAGAFYAPKKRR